MEKKISMLIIALIMSLGNVVAHEDVTCIMNFGNVKVKITSAYKYEETNKVAMIGQFAEKLCETMNYTGIVYLSFSMTSSSDPSISYGKSIFSSYGKPYENLSLDDKNRGIGNISDGENILISQKASSYFQTETTLKLLEYAILYLDSIKSIDAIKIKKILSASNSDLVKKILNQKVYRPEKDFKEGISYFSQNNKYYVFQKSIFFSGQETVVTELENIYDIRKVGSSAVVFDSDSSFYYVKQSGFLYFGNSQGGKQGDLKISKRQVIENRCGGRPFEKVETIGGEKIAIVFTCFTSWENEKDSKLVNVGDKDRTLLYLLEEDILIQDLDLLLKKNKKDYNQTENLR